MTNNLKEAIIREIEDSPCGEDGMGGYCSGCSYVTNAAYTRNKKKTSCALEVLGWLMKEDSYE